MSLLLAVSAGLHVQPVAAGLVEEVDVINDVTGASNPWTITDLAIPAGSNRLLVDLVCFEGGPPTSDVLDPGGGDEQALTLSEQSSATNEELCLFTLLAAGLPAAGAYDLAVTHTLAETGRRRTLAFSGAQQTVYSGAAVDSGDAVLVVSVTHPTGTFPVGSRVYAWFVDGDATPGVASWTVTGDAAKTREIAVSGVVTDKFVEAEGVLGAAKATVSVTFTGSEAVDRLEAVLIVVVPA